MGVVKYMGPVASFHCPTEATIRSLKVHFSPKQEGSGDPSPENVRPIEGWDGVQAYKCGKNLFDKTNITLNYRYNGDADLIFNKDNCVSDYIPVKPNTNYYLSNAGDLLINERCAWFDADKKVIGAAAAYYAVKVSPSNAAYVRITVHQADIDTAQFEEGLTATFYEPYHGSITNYEFGVLGKNKFNWNVSVSESSPVTSDAATAREFTLDTYVIGMSVNNYYRQNYTNWVLSPSVENGIISFSSGGASGYGIAFPLKLAAGQTYFLSGTSNGVVGATYYNEDGELISYQNGRLNKTITVPENTATTLIGFYASTSNTEFTFSNIQLELGSSATTYEPYDPNKTVYGGWVDLISGEVCEEYSKAILNGDNAFGSPNDYDTYYRFVKNYSALGLLEPKETQYPISNWLEGRASPNGVYIGSTKNVLLYLTKDLNISTSEILSAYLAENPLEIIYELATPNTYSLAPTQLQTFLGHNNVWSNADYVEVEYDLHETQNILARKQFIIANQPHIESASGAIMSFETDVPAPLKKCKVYFNPVQDLHGYDRPWVGGSGKNLFNPNCEMWDYSIYTKDGNNITQSGSDGRGWINTNFIPLHLTAGTYTISCSDGNNFSYATSLDEFATPTTLTNGGGTFTLSEDCDIKIKHSVKSGNSYPATFTVQLEKGSTATTYEPYENICPINGWTELETYRAEKSLVRFADSIGPTNRLYNGFSGWLLDGYWKIPDRTKTYTYSVYIDNKNAVEDSCVNVWFRNETNTSYVRTVNGSKIKAGEEGWSTLSFNNNNYYFAGLGITLQTGGIAKSGMLEIGDTATMYELYNGTTIPITFPSITNLLNSTTITANKTLSTAGEEMSESGMSVTDFIKVNEGDIYTLTFISKEGARTRRIYGYDTNKEPVESLASVSWVTIDTTGSIQATVPSGIEYIRISYKTADENIFLKGPKSSVVYGGYVDLVRGEIVATHGIITLTGTEGSWGYKSYWSGMITISASPVLLSATACSILPCINELPPILANRANKCIAQKRNDTLTVIGFGLADIYPDLQSFLNYVQEQYANGTPIQVIGLLETPITYSLTPQQLTTLRGTNNIWSNANGDVRVKYWTH